MNLQTKLNVSNWIELESEFEEQSTAKSIQTAKDDQVPQQKANIFSKLTFSWVSTMFKTGYKRTINQDDLYYLPHHCLSSNAYQQFADKWAPFTDLEPNHNENIEAPLILQPNNTNNKATKSQSNHRKHKLIKTLLNSFGTRFYMGVPLKIIAMILGFVNVSIVSSYLKAAESMNHDIIFRNYALIYAFAMFINSICATLINGQCEMFIRYIRIKTRIVLTDVIYHKVVRMTDASRRNADSGSIMTMITTDIHRIMVIFQDIFYILLSPIEAIISLYLLYRIIGWSIFVAVAAQIITITPIKAWISKKAKQNQKERMEVRDKRMKIINETLKSIEVIKMMGWIPSFSDAIIRIRDEGVQIYKYLLRLWRLMWLLWELAPVMLALVSYTLFTVSGGKLTVQIAFVSLMLFYKLRNPLQRIPGMILHLIQCKISLQRVETFLFKSKELNDNTIQYYSDKYINNRPMISCLNASFSWDDK
eukprot:362086_1